MVWLWAAFIAFVLLMLALDLSVFHRKAHVVSVKEALVWLAVWLAILAAGVAASLLADHRSAKRPTTR